MQRQIREAGDANFDILSWPITDPSVIGYYTLSDEVRIRVRRRPVRSVTREALGKSVVMTHLEDIQPDDRTIDSTASLLKIEPIEHLGTLRNFDM